MDTPPPGIEATYSDIAADASGNLYAVGERVDSNFKMHGIVREKLSGSDTWTTLLDYSSTSSSLGINFNAVAVSPSGDLYVGGSNWSASWVVLKRPAGQTAFAVVEQVSNGTLADLAVDSSGNVYSAGQVVVQVPVTSGRKPTTRTEWHWTVRRQSAGAGSFATIDRFGDTTAFTSPYSMTVVDGGASAGVYVVGRRAGATVNDPTQWIVRKGANGGATWTTVDTLLVDANSGSSVAEAITIDPAGNLFVAGEASQRALIGMTKQKTPIYSYTHQWVVRKGLNGGTSWTTDAAISIPQFADEPFGMGCDLSGVVYAVSPRYDSAGVPHSIISSNAGGSWQTVDDFQLNSGSSAYGNGFAAAPDGRLYAAGCAEDSAGTFHATVRMFDPATFSSQSIA